MDKNEESKCDDTEDEINVGLEKLLTYFIIIV